MPSLRAMASVRWNPYLPAGNAMKNYYPPLFEGTYYHIYNRGNNRENIFYSLRNYKYFLLKYDHYLSEYLDTYAYCLLPNHFHFFVKVKERENTDTIARSDGIGNNSNGIFLISSQISEQFRRFFIGYSQAINKQEHRSGSLFQKGFKRIHIDSQRHLIYLIYYIHANPKNHGLVEDFRKYPYSSYERILIDKATKLRKKEVLQWFGSKLEYIKFHEAVRDLEEIERFTIEEV